MSTQRLGRSVAAVYELVRRGALTSRMARFFEPEIDALKHAGLVRRDSTGRIFDSSLPPAPTVATTRVPLELPADVVAMLDQCATVWGVTRAAAAQRILAGVQQGGTRATDPPTSGERLAVRKPPNA